ncbi:MAG: hypothetical protein KAS63_02775 [Candidatus Heimdallarchaeota archaeon]|nr:hypothetical protein [Candidatus Heimdallarchaeota archaeon]MCK4954259.1 hypothetical protein [Candidatus Heimdallarchaeota archaeon]
MREIEKEDLMKYLKEKNDKSNATNPAVVDFVLWKLNEIKYEVSIKLKEREQRDTKKSSS